MDFSSNIAKVESKNVKLARKVLPKRQHICERKFKHTRKLRAEAKLALIMPRCKRICVICMKYP